MDTEIELKFLVPANLADELVKRLHQLGNITSSKTLHLVNTYYDTADLLLRRQDIGLRIRQSNNYCVQTVKLAGSSKSAVS